jgi:hypothetical protein
VPESTQGPIRVALIHDVRVVRAGLRQLTAPYSDRVLLLPDPSPAGAASAHLVMHGDLRPPRFTRVTPASMEILYTTRPRVEDVRAAAQHGAAGAADKDWTAQQLVSAIEQSVTAALRRGGAADERLPFPGPDDSVPPPLTTACRRP